MFIVIFFTILASITLSPTVTMALSKQESIYRNLSNSCNNFSNYFYKAVSRTENNIISAPLSLHVILTLLSHGAGGGATLDELKNVLHLGDVASTHDEIKSLVTTLKDTEEVELSLANILYVQEDLPIIKDFLKCSKSTFDCSVESVNFADGVSIVNQINLWVKTATKNKIINIVSTGKLNYRFHSNEYVIPSKTRFFTEDITEDTKMILLNAIYFKGHWLHKFNQELTEKRAFHITKAERKLVPTMFIKAKYFHGEISSLHSNFIEIPYQNTDIVMIIILPHEVDGLQFVENHFNWNDVLNTPGTNSVLELFLPKFKFEFTMHLIEVLQQIGLNELFQDTADFTKLSHVPLKVGNILQKVLIEVNEEGSEAAAATVVQMRLKRMIDIPEQFVVNHPFMFAIKHKPSNTPLFLGSVRNIYTTLDKDEL